MNQEDLSRQMSRLAEVYTGKCAIFNHRGKLLQELGESAAPLPNGSEIVEFMRSEEKQAELSGYDALRLDISPDQNLALLIAVDEITSEREIQLLKLWLSEAFTKEYGHKEKMAFLKNVLLENELPGDIPLKARTLKVDFHRPRKAILLRMPNADNREVLNLLEHLFPMEYENYFIPMDEENLLILFDLENLGEYSESEEENEGYEEEFDLLMHSIVDEIEELLQHDAHLGVGLVAEHLKDISRSYREASLALTVGAIFEEGQRLMRYDQLGLGRLIYQLPPTLCELFLTEVFRPGTYEQLDAETLVTIEKFFENNLNGSETSRKLFVHRNTLVYRLDKVEKITGLDLRIFDDAVLFKLASMVRKYLESLKAVDSAPALKSNLKKRRVRNKLD
ncbi:MAG: helix-turn-helix domain-containing protein [Eubacteriales bacterium]|nr:helix-turn-helix domain-containing protein [Eubacteriales bacterium]